MKIVQFTAENIKKLKVVSITPTGSVVQITGPNGSGKSSVLDAIFWALGGTEDIPSHPVRSGEQRAHVRLDLGEVVVTRKFAGDNSTLTVEAESGARFPSPQRMLDDLIGTLSFDPLEFSRKNSKAQLEELRRLVPLSVDVDALDGLNKRDYDDRTDLNRQLKQLRAQADGITVPADLPAEAVDVSALVAEIDKAGETNAERARLRANKNAAISKIGDLRVRVVNLKAELVNRERELELFRAQVTTVEQEAKDLQAYIDVTPDAPAAIDTTVLRDKINAAGDVNTALDRRQRRTDLLKQVADLETQCQGLTQAMDARTEEKTKAIGEAQMPVEGLGFGDGEILYNGLPFNQASSAEQLRVSVGIAMAANPKLRVLRIKDGSLLDESNLALIAGMAESKDYQVWIERVDTSGKVGIVMEDGQVKEVKS